MILEIPLPCSKIPLLVSIPTQINPVHTLTPYLSYTVRVKYPCASFDSYILLHIIVLNVTIQLIFIKEKDCILCEVRTKVLYMIQIKAVLIAGTRVQRKGSQRCVIFLPTIYFVTTRPILPIDATNLSASKQTIPPPGSLSVHVHFTQSLHMPKSSRTDDW